MSSKKERMEQGDIGEAWFKSWLSFYRFPYVWNPRDNVPDFLLPGKCCDVKTKDGHIPDLVSVDCVRKIKRLRMDLVLCELAGLSVVQVVWVRNRDIVFRQGGRHTRWDDACSLNFIPGAGSNGSGTDYIELDTEKTKYRALGELYGELEEYRSTDELSDIGLPDGCD